MIAIEACAPEITSHQNAEGLSMSRDEDEEAEEHCDLVYEEEKALKHQSLENETPEQEHDDGPEKLQRSAENLVKHTLQFKLPELTYCVNSNQCWS